MNRSLLIDPFSGASGDMLLAALIDCGASIDELSNALRTIPVLAELELDVTATERGAFTAKLLQFKLPHEHVHRGLSDIVAISNDANALSESVRTRAVTTFTRLAMAEAGKRGYGASFGGLAALLGMMTSCASGVTVVNIDNGYGAGSAAAIICLRARDIARRAQTEDEARR